MTEQPNYYSIIPAAVRYDEELRANEKLLYGEITALANKHGYSWATNLYFSKLYGVTRETVSRWISNLEKRGYVRTEVIRDKETREITKRVIYIESIPIDKKVNTPIDEKNNTLLTKKSKSNTTSNNTTSNNTSAQLTEDFEKLWKLYPNKKGKKRAFTSYKRAIKNGTTNKEIQTGIVNYKKELAKTDWLNPAHGSTWFHNERWADESTETTTQAVDKNIDIDNLSKLTGG